jgi:hypothetical protein
MSKKVSDIRVNDQIVSEQSCCDCVHFKFEDTDGWGLCAPLSKQRPKTNGIVRCSDSCICSSFISESVKAHHLAVLRKCKQCLNDNVGTEHAFDVKAITEAIDFVTEYANLY